MAQGMPWSSPPTLIRPRYHSHSPKEASFSANSDFCGKLSLSSLSSLSSEFLLPSVFHQTERSVRISRCYQQKKSTGSFQCSFQPIDGSKSGDSQSIPPGRGKSCHVAVPATLSNDRTEKSKLHGSISDHGSLTSNEFMSSSMAASLQSNEAPSLSEPYLSSPSPSLASYPSHDEHFPAIIGWMGRPRKSSNSSPFSPLPNAEDTLERGSSVAVIGAGVSGIAAAKTLKAKGYNVTVFESQGDLGGIWGRTYPSTSLQTPRTAYRFSDWPWPDSAPMNPSHVEVVEYLKGYVDHFGVGELIQFNTTVMEMKETEGKRRGWSLRLQRGKQGEREIEQWLQYDYVVMCCGCFSGLPNIPKFVPGKGPEVFGGTLMHSVDYSGLDAKGCHDLLHGKKVVVVGFQKTAIDVAMEAVGANKDPHLPSPTLLFRKTHWLVPRDQKIMGIHLKYLLLTRFMELFSPQPGLTSLHKMIQNIIPVRQMMNFMVESFLKAKYPLEKYGLIPSHSFLDDVSACILPQLPPSFFPLVEEGRIKLTKSATWHFTPGGVRLDDGRQVDADAVILCTGYDGLSKLKALLPSQYGSKLSNNGKSIYLYRGVVHPEIPSMAFLGFHEGLSSMQSSEMGARWLSKLMEGSFSLPSKPAMEEEINEWWEFKQTQTPFANRVSCVAPIHSWHFDHMCRDMGWNPMRKKGLIANWFTPYGSLDYAEPEVGGVKVEERENEKEGLALVSNLNGLEAVKPDFEKVLEPN